MSEQLRLNSRLVRAYLKAGHRKQSFLVEELEVSGSTVAHMLSDGHVPGEETLEKLARLMGVEVAKLLTPDEAKTA